MIFIQKNKFLLIIFFCVYVFLKIIDILSFSTQVNYYFLIIDLFI
jgi:hypothetical protein